MRLLSSIVFCVIITLSSNCYAVHSNIDKNITPYSCEDYTDVFRSIDAENALFSYLGDKRFNLTVYKIVNSSRYLQEIKNFIRNEYPSPIYAPQNVIAAIEKEEKIMIVQDVLFNLKNRSAYIANERLCGYPSNLTILNLKNDVVFPGESFIYDIDENQEYGQIANAAIDFMESIKDIYFDPEVRQKYKAEDSIYQLNRIRNDYLSYWSGDLTLVWQSSKNKSKIYMDIPSFRSAGEGWIQYIPDESSNIEFKETKIFVNVDYYNSKIYPIFKVKTNRSGIEEYHEISPTEVSTLGEWKFIDAVLTQLAKKFKLQKTYRQLTGVDIGQPYYP